MKKISKKGIEKAQNISALRFLFVVIYLVTASNTSGSSFRSPIC